MVIRTLKRVAATIVNAVIDRLNDATDRHNARVAEQSRQAVEQWTERTPVSPRFEFPYVVYFGSGERRECKHWEDARNYYLLVGGHGLVNKRYQTDGSSYAGLTEEQLGELGVLKMQLPKRPQ